jgi:hypothetical protein
MNILDDQEVRHLAISLMTAPTARDAQTRVGASNLSNQCDRCLAGNLMGDPRDTPLSAKTWMGRTLGTATHAILEDRVTIRVDAAEDPTGATSALLTRIANLEGAQVERHVWFGEIVGYGPIGGSIDLELLWQIVDWKSSTRKKSCLLLDYMAIRAGLPAIYGRTHKDVKLSEKVYAEEMAKMKYKVDGYFGQQCLYMRGSGKHHASLVLFNRDGTGYFDVPGEARYTDPTAVHDVNVVSFDYDAAYTDSLIARAQTIWDHLQAGAAPSAFSSHEHCFVCSNESSAPAVVPVETFEATLELQPA